MKSVFDYEHDSYVKHIKHRFSKFKRNTKSRFEVSRDYRDCENKKKFYLGEIKFICVFSLFFSSKK